MPLFGADPLQGRGATWNWNQVPSSSGKTGVRRHLAGGPHWPLMRAVVAYCVATDVGLLRGVNCRAGFHPRMLLSTDKRFWFLRLMPMSPMMPEPRSQAAAGIGVAATLVWS